MRTSSLSSSSVRAPGTRIARGERPVPGLSARIRGAGEGRCERAAAAETSTSRTKSRLEITSKRPSATMRPASAGSWNSSHRRALVRRARRVRTAGAAALIALALEEVGCERGSSVPAMRASITTPNAAASVRAVPLRDHPRLQARGHDAMSSSGSGPAIASASQTAFRCAAGRAGERRAGPRPRRDARVASSAQPAPRRPRPPRARAARSRA